MTRTGHGQVKKWGDVGKNYWKAREEFFKQMPPALRGDTDRSNAIWGEFWERFVRNQLRTDLPIDWTDDPGLSKAEILRRRDYVRREYYFVTQEEADRLVKIGYLKDPEEAAKELAYFDEHPLENPEARDRIMHAVEGMLLYYPNTRKWHETQGMTVVFNGFAEKAYDTFEEINTAQTPGEAIPINKLIYMDGTNWLEFVRTLRPDPADYAEGAKDPKYITALKDYKDLVIHSRDIWQRTRPINTPLPDGLSNTTKRRIVRWVGQQFPSQMGKTIQEAVVFRDAFYFWARVNFPMPKPPADWIEGDLKGEWVVKEEHAKDWEDLWRRQWQSTFPQLVDEVPMAPQSSEKWKETENAKTPVAPGSREHRPSWKDGLYSLVDSKLQIQMNYSGFGAAGMNALETTQDVVKHPDEVRRFMKRYPFLEFRMGKTQLVKWGREPGGREGPVPVTRMPLDKNIWSGKTHAQNEGTAFSRHELMMYFDWNITVPFEDAIRAMNALGEFQEDPDLMLLTFEEDVFNKRYNWVAETFGMGDETWTQEEQGGSLSQMPGRDRDDVYRGVEGSFGHSILFRREGVIAIGGQPHHFTGEDTIMTIRMFQNGYFTGHRSYMKFGKAPAAAFANAQVAMKKWAGNTAEYFLSGEIVDLARGGSLILPRLLMFIRSIAFYAPKFGMPVYSTLYIMFVIFLGVGTHRGMIFILLMGAWGLFNSQGGALPAWGRLVTRHWAASGWERPYSLSGGRVCFSCTWDPCWVKRSDF